MISRLAIFGATGDLTARYLLPGLAALRAAGHLGDDFRLAAVGREAWSNAEFQRWATDQNDRHAGHLPFGHSGEALPNVLRFGLEPENLALELTGIGAHAGTLVPLTLGARLDPPELPAYGRLLLGPLRPKAQSKQAPPAVINRRPHHRQSDQDRIPVSCSIHGGMPLAPHDIQTGGSGQRKAQAHQPEAHRLQIRSAQAEIVNISARQDTAKSTPEQHPKRD